MAWQPNHANSKDFDDLTCAPCVCLTIARPDPSETPKTQRQRQGQNTSGCLLRPPRFFAACEEDLPSTDLLIIAGTSLVVSPVKTSRGFVVGLICGGLVLNVIWVVVVVVGAKFGDGSPLSGACIFFVGNDSRRKRRHKALRTHPPWL